MIGQEFDLSSRHCFRRAWQAHHKSCPRADFALDLDPAAVPLHDLSADGESQAGAGGLPFIFAHPIEFFEQVRHGFIRNADAGILDGNADFHLARLAFHGDLSVRTVVFNGIRKQVEHDLLDLVAIGFQRWQVIRCIDHDFHLLFFRLRVHDVFAFIKQVRDGKVDFMELDAA